MQAVLSESVSFGEISFSGMLPSEGTSAAEIKALIAELRRDAWLPSIRKDVKMDTREGVKA
jgi:chromosome partitioning protein